LEGDNAHFLKTHLTGTILHGNGLALIFLDLMRWPQDANPTTNTLISTFQHIIHLVTTLSNSIVWDADVELIYFDQFSYVGIIMFMLY